jgi:uncharacterized protein (DUF58 family)
MNVKFSALAEYLQEVEARNPPSRIVRVTLEHRPYMRGLIIAVSLVVGHVGADGSLVECVEFVGERTTHNDTLSQEIMRRAHMRAQDTEQRLKALGLVVAQGRYQLPAEKGGA